MSLYSLDDLCVFAVYYEECCKSAPPTAAKVTTTTTTPTTTTTSTITGNTIERVSEKVSGREADPIELLMLEVVSILLLIAIICLVYTGEQHVQQHVVTL